MITKCFNKNCLLFCDNHESHCKKLSINGLVLCDDFTHDDYRGYLGSIVHVGKIDLSILVVETKKENRAWVPLYIQFLNNTGKRIICPKKIEDAFLEYSFDEISEKLNLSYH